MSAPRVLICHSLRDEAWKERLIQQLGIIATDVWDDHSIASGVDWLPEFTEAVGNARVAILLISADFLATPFVFGKEIPRLLERRRKEGLHIIPLILRPCAWQQVKWLHAGAAFPKSGRPLSRASDEEMDSALAALCSEITQTARRSRGYVPTMESISLSMLSTANPQLFGRDRELAALDAAWDNPHANVLQLIAPSGGGKTALLSAWLSRMAGSSWRDAERVFGWSFFVQGAIPGRETSADLFLAAALRWLGDPDPGQGSPWDKGERLAELIRDQRTLLVLDGVELLQYPPAKTTGGRLKDPAIETLLRELARGNPGLCVVTSSLAVDDLKDFAGRGVDTIEIDRLAPEYGYQYLKSLGVKGTSKELSHTTRDFHGHPLTLTLLGTHLVTGYDGAVRWTSMVKGLTPGAKPAELSRAVIEAHARWFEGRPEASIMLLLSVFDRPARVGALDALRHEPVIEGLTDRLVELPNSQWYAAIDVLRQVRLLEPENPQRPDALECHPVVREYFAGLLESAAPAAWFAAHARLYEYYRDLASEAPRTMEEMAPLYAATMHGCLAEKHRETFREIYLGRIQRGEEYFGRNRFGAFGAELAALAAFFSPPWESPVSSLGDLYIGILLNDAAYALRALGRLGEAVDPLKAALSLAIPRRRYAPAAVAASNLSELYLALGEIGKAIVSAEQSIELADRSGDAFQRLTRRTTLADILHQAGRLTEAERLFEQAEQVQRDDQFEFPLLYSLTGFRYCDLLLDLGRFADVHERALRTMEIARQNNWPSDVGLDHISLGRAALGENDLLKAEAHLNEAVVRLRQTGEQHFLPRALLASATLHRLRKEFALAERDLEEAAIVARRSDMRLHEADCRLEQSRLALAAGDAARATAHLAAATKLIQETGYHRRDRDIAEIEGQLQTATE